MKQYTIYFNITWVVEEGEDEFEIITINDRIDTNYLANTLEEISNNCDVQVLRIVKNY